MWYRLHEICSVLFLLVGACRFRSVPLLFYRCCRGQGFVKTILIDVFHMLIPVSFNGKALLLELDVKEGADAGVNDCKKRHTDNHAQYTHQTAEQSDGKNDPEAGEAGRASQDLGTKNVAVKLLQQQNEKDEV